MACALAAVVCPCLGVARLRVAPMSGLLWVTQGLSGPPNSLARGLDYGLFWVCSPVWESVTPAYDRLISGLKGLAVLQSAVACALAWCLVRRQTLGPKAH